LTISSAGTAPTPGTTFLIFDPLPGRLVDLVEGDDAPLFVAEKISTGIETKASLICPFQ
jgi:hypothetical protein